MPDIEVIVNGERTRVPGVSTIADLLIAEGYQVRFGAIAVNESFVSRDEYATRMLQAGDRVEVLMPFAGG